jgi:hypothetical protein
MQRKNTNVNMSQHVSKKYRIIAYLAQITCEKCLKIPNGQQIWLKEGVCIYICLFTDSDYPFGIFQLFLHIIYARYAIILFEFIPGFYWGSCCSLFGFHENVFILCLILLKNISTLETVQEITQLRKTIVGRIGRTIVFFKTLNNQLIILIWNHKFKSYIVYYLYHLPGFYWGSCCSLFGFLCSVL